MYAYCFMFDCFDLGGYWLRISYRIVFVMGSLFVGIKNKKTIYACVSKINLVVTNNGSKTELKGTEFLV